MTCEERIFPVQSDRPDGALDRIVVHLDATIGQEQVQAIPVFGDVFQGSAERGFGRDASAVLMQPYFECSQFRRGAFFAGGQSCLRVLTTDILFNTVEGRNLF